MRYIIIVVITQSSTSTIPYACLEESQLQVNVYEL